MDEINKYQNGIQEFTLGYKKFGFNIVKDEVIYREWAPNAKEANLIGDFNQWDRSSHSMIVDNYGVWELKIPFKNGICPIAHGSKVKISMVLKDGSRVERIPAWIRRATQNLSESPIYNGIFWNPPEKYVFKYPIPVKPKTLKIYESHVGIASPEKKVATYQNFTDNILPRIAYLGYNAIQCIICC